MQNYEIAYNNLIEKIKSTRRKENIFLFLNGLLLNLGISLISLFIAIIIESIAFGDTSLRTALFGFVFITFVVSFGVLVVPHLMRLSNLKNNPSINELALRIGLKFPDMDDKLCNALQLIPISKNPQGMSPTLALAAFQSYYESIHQRDFDVIINKDEFKRNIIIFLLPLFLLVGSISLFQSTLGDSLYRLANFNKSFLPPVPFHLEVIPASALLARGDKLHIEIKITGTIPAKVWLSTKEEFQTEFDSFEIRPNTEGKYIFEINPVKSSIEYFAHTEWYSERINSNHGFAKVIEKPIIKSITGRLVYPSYANLNPKFIDEKSADITALKGSKLNLELISNKEIKSAKLTFIKKNISSDSLSKKSDTSFISLAINGKKATGGLIVGSTGVYYIQIEDKDTYINENPINYSIIALNDDFPEISMLEPLSDIEINSNGLLSLKCKISDDYGFGNLKLFYRLAESPYTSPDQNYSSVDIKFVKNDLTIEVP